MLFPVSGVEISPFIPFAIGFSLAFLGVMGGVTGAFLLLPIQTEFLGYRSPGVSGTNLCYNLLTIPLTVWQYYKQGLFYFELFKPMFLGTFPGILIGVVLRITIFSKLKYFYFVVIGVLFYIFINLSKNIFFRKAIYKRKEINQESLKREIEDLLRKNFFKILFFSFFIGMLGGIYGIGGGAILAPYCIGVLNFPVTVVSGAALLVTFINSIAGVFFYILFSYFKGNLVKPDLLLGGLFGAGGMLGGYLGSKLQSRVPEVFIKLILWVMILLAIVRVLIRIV